MDLRRFQEKKLSKKEALDNLKNIRDPAQIGVSVREGIKSFIETISPLDDKDRSLKDHLEVYLNEKLAGISDKDLRDMKKLPILKHFNILSDSLLSVHKGSSKIIHSTKPTLDDAKYYLFLATLLIRRILELVDTPFNEFA